MNLQQLTERAVEIDVGPPGMRKLFSKVERSAKKQMGAENETHVAPTEEKVRNPYAVAWSVVKQKYYKGKGGRWRRRKESEESLSFMAAMEGKEANAATMLGQLFRNVPPEFAAWGARRRRMAAQQALALAEQADAMHMCGEGCPHMHEGDGPKVCNIEACPLLKHEAR